MKLTRGQRWWVAGGVAGLAFLTICFFTWPSRVLQLPLIVHDQPQAADVVIVLGAGARSHGDPLPPQAKERVERGAELMKQGLASAMIISGGLSKSSGYIEADLMKAYAVAQDLPAENIIEEKTSTSTWENAINSLEIMRRNNWQTALIVTSSYHTYRACAIFHHLRASVRCIAAPLNIIPTDSVYERLTDFRSVVREYGAVVLYGVTGRL